MSHCPVRCAVVFSLELKKKELDDLEALLAEMGVKQEGGDAQAGATDGKSGLKPGWRCGGRQGTVRVSQGEQAGASKRCSWRHHRPVYLGVI